VNREMNVNLHIEQLTLHGIDLPHHHRPLLQAAFETELSRLLAADGLTSGLLAGGAVPYMPTEDIRLAEMGNPVQLGQQIAQAVHGGISR
jgi:hypothetical protein